LVVAFTLSGKAWFALESLRSVVPYEAFALEAYIKAGGNPTGLEPLALSLKRFDCVTLVESCLAVARLGTKTDKPKWQQFAREIERMRYRGGKRAGYASRLHYFSEWISDGAKRGLVRDLGAELGGVNDDRPLRFMTEHRSSYPALANDKVFNEIAEMERSLDSHPRYVVKAERIPEVQDRIQTGDVLAFATAVPGIDVSHACACISRQCRRAESSARSVVGRCGRDHAHHASRIRLGNSSRDRNSRRAAFCRLAKRLTDRCFCKRRHYAVARLIGMHAVSRIFAAHSHSLVRHRRVQIDVDDLVLCRVAPDPLIQSRQ
jgi:hypothetical protein